MGKANNETQIVIFRLGEEEYGLNISKIQEIIRVPGITRLPNTPDYVLGMFNLRGDIIPIIDLKKKFLRVFEEYTAEARVIVMETEDAKVGIIVDEISEIMAVSSELSVGKEKISASIKSDNLLGVVTIAERLIILLDNEKILM